MNTPVKVAGFAVGLLAVFAAATGVGALVGPVGGSGTTGTAAAGGHTSEHTSTKPADQPELPGGLMVSQDGYTLDLARRQLGASSSAQLEFRILGPDGQPVTEYTRKHDKDLHLIAVRRDLTGFQHVHPQLAEDGTWTVPIALARGGVYRIFADFAPAARPEGLTLGADLSVAGDYDPQPLPASTKTAQVDGYTVALDGTLAAGQESKLTLTVSKDGRPVTDLQPYLEAYGHLVALRDRDLAYLHVHPAGTPVTARPHPVPVSPSTPPPPATALTDSSWTSATTTRFVRRSSRSPPTPRQRPSQAGTGPPPRSPPPASRARGLKVRHRRPALPSRLRSTTRIRGTATAAEHRSLH